jgi:hypothetical protein
MERVAYREWTEVVECLIGVSSVPSEHAAVHTTARVSQYIIRGVEGAPFSTTCIKWPRADATSARSFLGAVGLVLG